MSDPLSSARIKIDRAKKHFAEIDAAIAAFEARDPFYVETDKESDPRYEIYRFRQREAIPPTWGAIVGDCAHNLRSALDHLAVALVVQGGGTPTQYTSFPIGRDEADFRSRLKSRLNGASAQAIALIEGLQPYSGADNPIFALHSLDILDKHENLVPVAAANSRRGFKIDIRQPGTEHYPPARMLRGPPLERKFPLKDGDELGSYLRESGDNIEDNSEFEFEFEISFGKAQIFDGEAVRPTLTKLVDLTEGIIKAFASGIWNLSW